MNRYVTFTFDDGLINTAKIVKNLKIPATFYIVLGWVLKEIEIKDSFNSNLDHGNINDWLNLELDIGCHTYDHGKEINENLSYNKFSKYFKGIKNLATPYGLKYYPKIYDSCKIGFYNKPYNSLCNIKQINSINPNYDLDDKEILKSIIKKCPPYQWIVFTFHGIDEGWNPIKLEELKSWIDFFEENNFIFLSMTERIKKFKKY
jgi:peptidoglycan/xylan/chitin deacetylase (PgdA/CDA1 family)